MEKSWDFYHDNGDEDDDDEDRDDDRYDDEDDDRYDDIVSKYSVIMMINLIYHNNSHTSHIYAIQSTTISYLT